MRSILVFTLFLGLMGSASAQPGSATGECRFREGGKDGLVCRASFEFTGFQSDSPSNLRVACDEGKARVVVYDDSAELASVGDNLMAIEPRGSRTLPAVVIRNDSFSCAPPIPRTVDAVLVLPDRVPFENERLRGECEVTPRCGS